MRLAHAPIFVQLLLLAGAVARLTLLVVDDRITRSLRWWLLRRLDDDGYLAYLVSCCWCVGLHWALWLSVLWLIWPGQTLVFCLPWAVAMVGSAASGYVAEPEPPPES